MSLKSKSEHFNAIRYKIREEVRKDEKFEINNWKLISTYDLIDDMMSDDALASVVLELIN